MSYRIHKMSHGLREIIAPNGTLICTTTSDILAAQLVAVFMVAELDAPISWGTQASAPLVPQAGENETGGSHS